MATFYRCDRCKTEITTKSDLRPVKLPQVNKWRNKFTGFGDDDFWQELCIACVRGLYEALDPPKVEPDV